MEEDLNFSKMKEDFNLENGRLNQYCGKCKTTSIFFPMEGDLYYLENGRRPQLFGKWKTTSIIWKMEDNLNL